MRIVLTLAIGATIAASSLFAGTAISTINGFYDVDAYDTPSLHISNSTTYDFTNVQLTLTGYQGLNQGVVNNYTIGTIAAGSTAIETWGGMPGASGKLLAYDYDDEYGGTFAPQAGYGLAANGQLVAAPQCIQGWNDCAQTGNFYVTLTAMWNGQPIYAQFSPDPTLPGAGNAAGTFVGWEGLDPNGWAETSYDSHSNGGPNGVLAYIYQGTPPPLVPEPASLALTGLALLTAFAVMRKRRNA